MIYVLRRDKNDVVMVCEALLLSAAVLKLPKLSVFEPTRR